MATINNLDAHLRYPLLISSTVLLWLRFIFLCIGWCKSRVIRYNFEGPLIKSVHFVFCISLIITDATISYGWIFLKDEAASPPTLAWVFFWLMVNVVAMTMIMTSIIHTEKWPIMWHTTCAAYTLCCIFHVMEGITRGDVPITFIFPCISALLGYFVISYVPETLMVTIDNAREGNMFSFAHGDKDDLFTETDVDDINGDIGEEGDFIPMRPLNSGDEILTDSPFEDDL